MSENISHTYYNSVDYHCLKSGEDFILFDVERMRVHTGTSDDMDVLSRARNPIPLEKLRKTINNPDRLNELVTLEMIIPSSQTVEKAPVAKPTNYATFMVNVSQRCNLTCPYCYVNKGHFDYVEKPIPKMAMSDAGLFVNRVHNQFPGFHIYGYHFYGGEPLLNFKAIRTIVEKAEEKAEASGTETDYHITTNGTLLTTEIADFMDKHRFTVYYSIDSNKDNHDELRKYLDGSGSYDDVEKNLELLRSRQGVHLIGSSVVREGNSLTDAIQSLKTKGSQQCKAERVRLHDDDPLALVDDNFDQYLDDVHSLASHYIDFIERGEKPLDYRLASKILQLLTRKRRDFFCPAGDRMFGVSSDGELYPCALHVGRESSILGDIENGPDAEKVADFRYKFSAEGQEVCRTCWNKTLCGGGCSAMVDRFGHEKCDSLKAESEAALLVYKHFFKTDPIKLLTLVSPKIVAWAEGVITNPEELALTEPAAEMDRGDLYANTAP